MAQPRSAPPPPHHTGAMQAPCTLPRTMSTGASSSAAKRPLSSTRLPMPSTVGPSMITRSLSLWVGGWVGGGEEELYYREEEARRRRGGRVRVWGVARGGTPGTAVRPVPKTTTPAAARHHPTVPHTVPAVLLVLAKHTVHQLLCAPRGQQRLQGWQWAAVGGSGCTGRRRAVSARRRPYRRPALHLPPPQPQRERGGQKAVACRTCASSSLTPYMRDGSSGRSKADLSLWAGGRAGAVGGALHPPARPAVQCRPAQVCGPAPSEAALQGCHDASAAGGTPLQ